MASEQTINRIKRAAESATLAEMVKRGRAAAGQLEEQDGDALRRIIGDICADYVTRDEAQGEDEGLYVKRLGDKLAMFAHLLDASDWPHVE